MATAPNVTYIANHSDGEVSTRSSRTRVHTHAVEATLSDGKLGALTWHTSEALASKEAQTRAGMPGWTNVGVVAVTAHPFSSEQAKKARAAEKVRLESK